MRSLRAGLDFVAQFSEHFLVLARKIAKRSFQHVRLRQCSLGKHKWKIGTTQLCASCLGGRRLQIQEDCAHGKVLHHQSCLDKFQCSPRVLAKTLSPRASLRRNSSFILLARAETPTQDEQPTRGKKTSIERRITCLLRQQRLEKSGNENKWDPRHSVMQHDECSVKQKAWTKKDAQWEVTAAVVC